MAQRNISFGYSLRRGSADLLHIEIPGGVVNVRVGMHDADGRPVASVSIEANGSRYAGDPEWWIDGQKGKSTAGARIVCTGYAPKAGG